MVLANKALSTLRDVLAQPGWVREDSPTAKAKAVYLAGKMLCEVLPEPLTAPGSDDFPTNDFTLDDKMTRCCKQAIRYFCEEDRVLKGKYLNILIESFKVLED
jgi:hypothetical protein